VRRAVVGLVLAGLVVPALAACSGDEAADTQSKTTTTSTTRTRPPAMSVTSPEFADGSTIPTQFTCAGAGEVPELSWTAPPSRTNELALLVFDPDAGADGFVHFLRWGIDPSVRGTQRNSFPSGVPGMNGRGGEDWVPPCPPAGGPHRYQFTIYALDHEPQIAPTANVQQFLDAIQGSVIAEGHLTGRFGR
jgi:Raf kinase inhibitor-like YbhB/YbcL family protein